MKIKQYMNIIKNTFEKEGHPYDKNVIILAINKLLTAPAMKDAFDTIEMKRDFNTQELELREKNYNSDYNITGNIRFESVLDDNYNFQFRKPKYGTIYHNEPDTLKSDDTINAAKKISDSLNSHDNYNDFLNSIEVCDLKKISRYCNRTQSRLIEFMVRMRDDLSSNTKSNDREFMDSVLSFLEDTKGLEQLVDTKIKSKICRIVKEGISEELELSDKIAILNVDHYEISNYQFEGLDEDEQLKYMNKIINEGISKDSVSYLLFNDPHNFIYNVFDKCLFKDLKKSLIFEMKLIKNELSIEELYNDNPIVEKIYNEALKQDPKLKDTAEDNFKHVILLDKDIYNKEKSNDFTDYLDKTKLFDNYESFFQSRLNTPLFDNKYSFINPDNNTVRFIGTTGIETKYMIYATLINNEQTLVKNRMLNVDLFNLSKLSEDRFVEAIENIVFYCKEKDHVLIIDNFSLTSGLNFREQTLLCETLEKYSDVVISTIGQPTSKEFKLYENLDMPISEILKVKDKISDLVYKGKSVEDIKKAIMDTNNKPTLKLK